MDKRADLSFLMLLLQVFNLKGFTPEETKKNIGLVMGDALAGNICVSPKLFISFTEGYKNAIKKYGLDIANIRMKEYLTKVILKDTNHTEESLYKYMNDVWDGVNCILDGIHLYKDDNGEYHKIE